MAKEKSLYDRSVFINCPFDSEYVPMFEAIIFKQMSKKSRQALVNSLPQKEDFPSQQEFEEAMGYYQSQHGTDKFEEHMANLLRPATENPEKTQ